MIKELILMIGLTTIPVMSSPEPSAEVVKIRTHLETFRNLNLIEGFRLFDCILDQSVKAPITESDRNLLSPILDKVNAKWLEYMQANQDAINALGGHELTVEEQRNLLHTK